MNKSTLFFLLLFFSCLTQASAAPVVAITNPDNQSTFTAGSDLTIIAAAAEPEGGIASVAFYNGPTLLGRSIKSPYTYIWADLAVGSYALTAVATDTNNISTTSGIITLTVTPAPPLVVISSPANNSTYSAGSNIDLAATALETNGTISAISFYNGPSLLATSSAPSSSYNYVWANVPAGSYALTAVATDAHKLTGTSNPITVMVSSSQAPALAITGPANGAVFEAGPGITMTVSASDSKGAINEVFFYDGAFYLGSSTVYPYTYVWHHAPIGAHTLTAEATDNNGGTLMSTPVNITVSPATNPVVAAPISTKK